MRRRNTTRRRSHRRTTSRTRSARGPEVRRWYAQMLLDLNAAGDRDNARTLLGEAIAQYRTIGMAKHLAMAERMLKTV